MATLRTVQDGQARLIASGVATELVLDSKIWDGLVSKIKSGEYAVVDDNGSPVPVAPEPYRYGDGPNDYIAVTFEPSVVLVRDGNDPRGLAIQIPNREWQALGDREVPGTEDGQDPEQVDNLRNSNDPTVLTTNTQNPDQEAKMEQQNREHVGQGDERATNPATTPADAGTNRTEADKTASTSETQSDANTGKSARTTRSTRNK